MSDASDDHEKLLARASAAIAEATQLMEENRKWQANINGKLKRMHFRASFYPRTIKLLSPLDFPDRPRLLYRSFPSGKAG